VSDAPSSRVLLADTPPPVQELRAAAQPSSASTVEPLLTVREAAAFLRISERSLWQFTKVGALRCVRLGRAVRYDRRDLIAFIDKHK
jgi:excisionase family DNA binding protein